MVFVHWIVSNIFLERLLLFLLEIILNASGNKDPNDQA